MRFRSLFTRGREKETTTDSPSSVTVVAEGQDRANGTAEGVKSAIVGVVAEAEADYKAELLEKMDDFRAKVKAKEAEGHVLFEAQTLIVAKEISDALDIENINDLLGKIKSEIEIGQKTQFEEFNQGTVMIHLSRLGEALFAGKPKDGIPPEVYYQAINEIGLRIAQAFDHCILMNTVYPGYAVQVPEHEVVNRSSGNKVGEVIRWGCEISGKPHTRMKPQVKAVDEKDLPPFAPTSHLYPEDL